MGKLWWHFQNTKFRTKLAVAFILLALVPFSVFAGVSSSIFLHQARETAMQHTAQATAQATSSIDIYIHDIDKLAQMWIRNIQRSGILAMEPGHPDWEAAELDMRQSLEDLSETHGEIAGIMIALDDNRSISTSMTRISRDPFPQENWYRLAEACPEDFRLISNVAGRNIVTNQAYSFDDVFSLVRAVPDPDTGEVRGVILFDVRHDIIRDSIDGAAIGQQGFAFVLDSENEMVYTPANEIVYRIDPLSLQDGDPVNMTISGGQYHIRTDESALTGWKTVGVFSMDEVLGGITAIYPILAISIALVVLLVIVFSLQISKSVTRPISKLQGLMLQAEEGDLSIRFNARYSDEIGALGTSFNHMLERIEHLIDRVYQEQKSKRDAELKSLQEQIKPHFLYNTLDTISWMARDQGARDVVRLVDALTNMFQVGLSQGKDFITVEQEISHIANYLYIQGVRYREKLGYEIKIDQAIYGYMIPKLILQPLVENAIYHGIKQKRGPGMIVVTGGFSEDGTAIWLTVRDNGAGMTEERRLELTEKLKDPFSLGERPSFGLYYVAEQIQLCYGEGYGLTIESEQGEGTCVTVRLPAGPGAGGRLPGGRDDG